LVGEREDFFSKNLAFLSAFELGLLGKATRSMFRKQEGTEKDQLEYERESKVLRSRWDVVRKRRKGRDGGTERKEEKRRTTTRPSVRDVVLLRVEPDIRRRVVDVGEVLDSGVPRRIRDVLEDDDGRTVVVDPLEHAVEGATCEEARREGRGE
jgi:hypothetical protein